MNADTPRQRAAAGAGQQLVANSATGREKALWRSLVVRTVRTHHSAIDELAPMQSPLP